MKRLILLILLPLLIGYPATAEDTAAEAPPNDRTMAITFDDLPAQRSQSLPLERTIRIQHELVEVFSREKIPGIGFVNEVKLVDEGEINPKRVELLELWLDAGLELGNHSYSHPSLHRTPLDEFQQDVLRGEEVTRRLIEQRDGELQWFRHPYLHTGRDLETKHGLEEFLMEHGYRVAPVTVDNSEWIFARAYDRAIEREDKALQERIGKTYVDYMEEMVAYYEEQSTRLFQREIPQILLVHANDLNADYFAPLLRRLEARGYRWIDLATAMKDPAYESPDIYVGPGGITWLHRWAITREEDPSIFRGEPSTPEWIQETAGIEE